MLYFNCHLRGPQDPLNQWFTNVSGPRKTLNIFGALRSTKYGFVKGLADHLVISLTAHLWSAEQTLGITVLSIPRMRKFKFLVCIMISVLVIH
jgi:hypothetical protein